MLPGNNDGALQGTPSGIVGLIVQPACLALLGGLGHARERFRKLTPLFD